MKLLILKSKFGRNVLTIMTGSIIAQAVPIAISPILTRLFTPEDFGILALFVAITSIIGAIATLRYELAIVQPHHEEDAAAIAVLSVVISTAISLLTFVIISIYSTHIQNWLENDEIGSWMYLIPVSILFRGIYQSLNFWHIRKDRYKITAYSKANQGLSTGGLQVSAGFMTLGSSSLLWSFVAGQFIALVTLLRKTLRQDKETFSKISLNLIKINAIRYKKIPLYSAPGALADTLSLQMPILVLSSFYNTATSGVFSLTFKVLNLPMSLASSAISQVLFQKISKMQHQSPYEIKKIIIKLFLFLIVSMIPFVSLIWIFGEQLFVFVFGEAWRDAGTIASTLVFAVAIRFSVSSLSSVLALEHNIKMGMTWQLIYLSTISSTLLYFSSYTIEILLYAFVVHEIMLYLLYFSFILKGSTYLKVV